jgi:hypothetical protein
VSRQLAPVAPAGLEPARSCEQGILSRTAGDLTNHEREIIAQDDTRSDTDAHECPPRVDDPASESDPVELALATAFYRASVAGQWTVAEVLARELEARRKARSAVVQLNAERRRRDGETVRYKDRAHAREVGWVRPP